jgi:hypothetical protein
MDLLPLTEYNRRASLGIEDGFLKGIYPNWSSDLHKRGNVLSNTNLETIAVHGIIRWYMKNNAVYDIDYQYPERIKYFIENPNLIQYHDFLMLYKVIQHHQIKLPYFNGLNFEKHNTKYSFLLNKYILYKLKKDKDDINFTKYSIQRFSYFLIDHIGYDNIIHFLKQVEFFINQKINWFDNGTIFDTFISKYPEIKVWGTIFQRFKVIVEKMEYIKHKDIYKLNGFVENVQQLIYSLSYYYCNVIDLQLSSPIVIRHPIIDTLKNQKLLEYYPIDNLKSFDFSFLL